jgi:ligand-binding sensor domain-containing protein
VCRYNGKTLVNFTVRDGLASNQIRGIQEDKVGNIYFTTYAGISKFDGRAFTTLSVSVSSAPTDWKLQPDDLWFVGPPDAGGVYRYDGKVDGSGALWMATYGEGVWRYDGMRTAHYPVNDANKVLTLFSIHKDNQGVMWVGTHSAGAYRFNGTSFETFRP